MKPLLAAFAILLSITATATAQTVDDGWEAYDAGDYEKAKSIFLPLVKSGNAKAMNAVGLMYSEGKAYPKDRKTACDWYEKSAKAGYASAQYNLAICFDDGNGRRNDIAKAIHWYEKAAWQEDKLSQTQLLYKYHGHDKDKAQYWGDKAIKNGSVNAKLGLWLLSGVELKGPPPTASEIACGVVMLWWLDKPFDYCD